ncbi:MAG: radical SAM family heme chaperone HemW [Vicingaceae bacterium]
MAGIYFHIPFCRKACHYCDFHFSVSVKNKEAVLNAMRAELEQSYAYLEGDRVDSIYFGGGTPSLLNCEDIGHFLDLLRRRVDLKDLEITLEANPDDLNEKKLDELLLAGINRLSIGVQSFHDKDLRTLNRMHTGEDAKRSIQLAKQAGFENINMDLIYGLPDSSLSEWQENLDLFLELELPHLSAYSLTYEDKTTFGKKLKNGEIVPLPEDTVIGEFHLLMSKLDAAGYGHYEISNFCLPEKHSRHNSSYWSGEKYLGIGPSAHSFNGKSRRWNVSNNARYLKAVEQDLPFFEEEVLSERDRFNEYLLTSLRTSAGCSILKVSRDYGDLRGKHLLGELQKLVKRGLMAQSNESFILSEKGKLVADKITSDLFEL